MTILTGEISIRTLMIAQIQLGIALFACLAIYWRYQKTYPGYLHWLASYGCSVTMLILYTERGNIPALFSVVMANILGIVAMVLMYTGHSLFNGRAEFRWKKTWPAFAAAAAIVYFSLVQDDILMRTVVMTANVTFYSVLISRVCWLHRSGRQWIGCKLFALLFLAFSIISILRIVVWFIMPEQRGLFQSAPVNELFASFFTLLFIGIAFSLILVNGLRIAEDLSREKELTLKGQADLLETQRQLRQAILFAPLPLMVHDEDGGVIQLSETWSEITGYGLNEIPNVRAWTRLAYGEKQAEVLRVIESLNTIETRVDSGEFTIMTRKGEQRVWSFSSAPLGQFDGKRVLISMAVDVTKRKQTEAQLLQLNRELEDRVLERTAELEDLYNNAPCGYHSLDADGVIVRINDTELKWIGLSREEVIGKYKLSDFVSEKYADVVPQALRRLKTQGFTADVNFELRSVDGSCRHVIGSATAIFDDKGNYLRSRSTLFDISEQYYFNLQSNQREQIMQAFLDEASDPVHITNAAGRFLYVNQAWLALFGYSRDEAERLSLYDVTNPSEHVRWDLLLHTAMDKGAHQRSEYVFVDKNGHSLFIETVILSRYEKERFVGTQAILIDVTTRRKMEEALREGQRQLSIANQELERVSRLKDDFLASMSHELRTPLTAVIGLSELLREGAYGALPGEQQEVVVSIEQSGRHLLALINDILDLSKLEAKQVALEIEECSAADIGQASLQFIRSMAAKKQIAVDFIMQPASIALQADPRRLKQMLINLLSNAVKFTPEGGKVGLQIRADKDSRKIFLTVWDTGIGIKGEDMGKLFQPFVQIDSSLGRQYAGTGLGLVLVQKAARMHGGQVLVESTPDVGSRFTIEIPWQPGENEPAGAAASAVPAAALAQPEGSDEARYPLVLLAEDNPENAKVIAGALRNKPWRLIVAEDGVGAIEQASGKRPDLILMDVQMPNMDGLSAIRLIRADPDLQLARTPIIALTALAMKGDRERCLRAGADDYLAKPIDFKELLSKMQALVQAAQPK